MAWAKLDDAFTDHPKVDGLSDGAFRLHVGAICHCARYLTDGFVAADRVPRLTRRYRRAHVVELEKARLWRKVDGGWEVNDYLDYNPSSDTVRRDREAAAERQRRRRRAPSGAYEADGHGVTHGVTEGVTVGVTHAVSHAHPVPSRPLATSQTPTDVSGAGPTGGGGQSVIDQATAFVVADEIERRQGSDDPVRSPEGYARTRHAPVRAQHEAQWVELLERTPTLTARQLADYAIGRLKVTPLDDAARAARALRERDRSCPTCRGSGIELDADDHAIPCPTCRPEVSLL